MVHYIFHYPTWMCALTQLWLATAEEAEGGGGKYYSAYCRDFSRYADPRVWDENTQEVMIEWCDAQIQLFEFEIN